MKTKKDSKIKVLFFGLGSIGKRHGRLLKEGFDAKLYAYRTGKGREKNQLGAKEFDDLEKAFSVKPGIAFITNPTSLHVPTALECAKRGINLFIEKPIGSSLEGLEELEKLVKQKKLVSYVAYNLRFHPVIEHLKRVVEEKGKPLSFKAVCSSYLPNWRPGGDYRESYSARRELGGGVILDLSHEFDYIAWLFQGIKKIEGQCGKSSKLKMDCEDFADAKIACGNGVKGSLHLDCFTVSEERKISIEYEEETIEGDLLHYTLKRAVKGRDVETREFETRADDMYRKQLHYFLDNYRKGNWNMMNSLGEASDLFRKIIKFKESCTVMPAPKKEKGYEGESL